MNIYARWFGQSALELALNTYKFPVSSGNLIATDTLTFRDLDLTNTHTAAFVAYIVAFATSFVSAGLCVGLCLLLVVAFAFRGLTSKA